MKLIIFYEKPGCVTNARQKKSLQKSGFVLIEKNLLDHGMSHEELLTYLEKRPVCEWFNSNAPAIKKKQIIPDTYTQEEALSLLHDNPILIRRPLLSVDGHRMCGFDKSVIEDILGVRLDIEQEEKCASDTTCSPPVSASSSE